ncbi:unnamed protein product [Boreogadus saida]
MRCSSVGLRASWTSSSEHQEEAELDPCGAFIILLPPSHPGERWGLFPSARSIPTPQARLTAHPEGRGSGEFPENDLSLNLSLKLSAPCRASNAPQQAPTNPLSTRS